MKKKNEERAREKEKIVNISKHQSQKIERYRHTIIAERDFGWNEAKREQEQEPKKILRGTEHELYDINAYSVRANE